MELFRKCEDPKQLCLQRGLLSVSCGYNPILLQIFLFPFLFVKWETRVTHRISDCLDNHFPTNKGPKYLQYSNSLKDTFILCFIQLF